MKKMILAAIIACFTLNSCMYLGHFGKRPLYLVDAPDDIQVKHNGKKVDVKEEFMTTRVTADYGAVREKTKYWHPASMVKVRRNNKIELSSGGKTAVLNVQGKTAKGIVFLVLEAPFTLGIGTIVDLATISFYHPASKFIDVDAALNHTTPREKKELYKIALQNSTKEVFTETRTK